MRKRVVVTGMSGVTALGNDYDSMSARMLKNESAIRYMPDWEIYDGLNTKLAGPIENFEVPEYYTRKQMRSMGRVSKLAAVATERALKAASLLETQSLTNGDTGIAYGSSTGSTPPILAFSKMVTERSTRGLTATSYVQMMSHTCAVNVGLFFGVKGRLIPTSSACTSASQAIGYGYESIKHGYQKAMITGGGEELCPTEAAVFDTLFATSTKNSEPNKTPSPYDKSRDGLVIGEGAATLILEELEHAKARGVPIFAELVGFGTCCDAQHITHPDAVMMQAAMELAIKDAGIHPDEVGYVSGHATATDRGDIAESLATSRVFKRKIPISSMKGHFGHTLGACGSIEAWLAIEMMNRNLFSPTLNLKEPDPLCAPLDYIMGGWRNINTQYIMSNNFGFGGINTSLVFKRWNG